MPAAVPLGRGLGLATLCLLLGDAWAFTPRPSPPLLAPGRSGRSLLAGPPVPLNRAVAAPLRFRKGAGGISRAPGGRPGGAATPRRAYGPGYEGIGVFLTPLPLVALKWNTVGALLLFATGKYKSALTKEGLLHSWLLGCILWGTLGLRAWSTCVVYLVVGSIATKIKKAEKEARGIAEGRGGQRGPENVWGSAATAAMCSILAIFSPWDSMIFRVGFAASLATKLSDTMASEIGKAYGRTTYLITTLERVEPGTEGAVSMEGTLAGVLGSAILALYAWLAGIVNLQGVLLCMLAAFVATNVESYIGATAQGKYLWLTNEVVNFINTAVGAVVAMGLFLLLR